MTFQITDTQFVILPKLLAYCFRGRGIVYWNVFWMYERIVNQNFGVSRRVLSKLFVLTIQLLWIIVVTKIHKVVGKELYFNRNDVKLRLFHHAFLYDCSHYKSWKMLDWNILCIKHRYICKDIPVYMMFNGTLSMPKQVSSVYVPLFLFVLMKENTLGKKRVQKKNNQWLILYNILLYQNKGTFTCITLQFSL